MRIYLLFLPPILVLLVWSIGYLQLMSLGLCDYGYYMLFGNVVSILILFYFSFYLTGKIKNTPSVYTSKINFDFDLRIIAVLFLILTCVYTIRYFVLSNYYGTDIARFELRKSPGFGFISRYIYWGCITILPLLVFNKDKTFLIPIFLVISFLSGSKAGFVWSFISMLSAFYFFNYRWFTFFRIILLAIVILILLAFTFYFYSKDMDDVDGANPINMIFYRLGYGAVEGIIFVEEFYSEHGKSFPLFTFDRTVQSLGSTLRILKSDGIGDTGVYLANYFGRENSLASYTISSAGFGLLEFGRFGAFLIPILSSILYCLFIKQIFNISLKLFVILTPASMVMFSHWLDWGWLDGILNFSFIYILFTLLIIYLFDRFKNFIYL